MYVLIISLILETLLTMCGIIWKKRTDRSFAKLRPVMNLIVLLVIVNSKRLCLLPENVNYVSVFSRQLKIHKQYKSNNSYSTCTNLSSILFSEYFTTATQHDLFINFNYFIIVLYCIMQMPFCIS